MKLKIEVNKDGTVVKIWNAMWMLLWIALFSSCFLDAMKFFLIIDEYTVKQFWNVFSMGLWAVMTFQFSCDYFWKSCSEQEKKDDEEFEFEDEDEPVDYTPDEFAGLKEFDSEKEMVESLTGKTKQG